MAKSPPSANVASVLATVAGNIDPADAIRNSVRECFDEAIRTTRSFDQALVAVFSQGIELGMSQKPRRPHRKTTNGQQAQASE